MQASEGKYARAAENMMVRMRFPGSPARSTKSGKVWLKRRLPSQSEISAVSLIGRVFFRSRYWRWPPPDFVPTISCLTLKPQQALVHTYAPIPTCTCYVFMSISTSHSFPSSSSTPSYIPSDRPSQIKFFRPAQMALFAKIITHPPLAQASIIPPSRKEVSLRSWQCLQLRYHFGARRSVCIS